jgi:biotin operon repressor
MNKEPTMEAPELLNLLQAHRGRANGIHCAALASRAGLSERVVRRLISDLRFEGCGIVGTPETGYFLAQTPEEIKEFEEFHFARARHSLGIISRVRGIALPALLGQLSLVESKS